MSKKAPSPRRTHIKEAHTVMQEALLHVGGSPAVAGGKNAQVAAHKRVASAVGVSASMLYKWREPPSAVVATPIRSNAWPSWSPPPATIESLIG